MHTCIKFLKHYITATNQHGVHSPFVFDYLTKCLYAKEKYSEYKSLNVFLKSISYFNFKSVHVLSTKSKLKEMVMSKYPNTNCNPPYDIIYITEMDMEQIERSMQNDVHLHSMLLFDAIRATNDRLGVWEEIIQQDKVTVSMDLFYCGVVFLRKEQRKEHFKIRI